jgi:TorA maturation chaperone TorD
MTNADIAAALNLMGALFRLDPVDPALQPVLAGLAHGDFAVDWPCAGEAGPARDAMAPLAADSAEARTALHAAYRDLFVGPAALPAPPWGSVYLDEEKVLFGASTCSLNTFLDRNAITFRDPDHGPQDHFGTLCWIGAWLASEDRMDVFDELMGEHVLPWAFLYLDELKTAALAMAQDNPASAFYAAAADLAAATLGAIQAERPVEIAEKKLYPSHAGASSEGEKRIQNFFTTKDTKDTKEI